MDDVITSGWTFQSAATLIQGYGGTPVGVFLAGRTRLFMKERRICYATVKSATESFPIPLNDCCMSCFQKRQDAFNKVKEYLHENPSASVAEVSTATEVDLETIYEFIREGRLAIIPRDIQLECDICGAPITVGRVCAKCRTDLKGGKDRRLKTEEKKERATSRVHYLDQIKDRR